MFKIIKQAVAQRKHKQMLIEKVVSARKDLFGWGFQNKEALKNFKQEYENREPLPLKSMDVFVSNVLRYGVSQDDVRCVRWVDFGVVEYCSQLDGTVFPVDKVCNNTSCPMYPKYTAFLDALHEAEEVCKLNLKKLAQNERMIADYISKQTR